MKTNFSNVTEYNNWMIILITLAFNDAWIPPSENKIAAKAYLILPRPHHKRDGNFAALLYSLKVKNRFFLT